MGTITIKRPVILKAIVTEKLKEELKAELQQAADHADIRIQQLEFTSKRYIQELQKTDIKQAMALRQQVQAEQQKNEQTKQQILEKKRQIEELELDSEFVRGTLEGLVDVKEGDDLGKIMSGAEIVVKDDIIVEVRGA